MKVAAQSQTLTIQSEIAQRRNGRRPNQRRGMALLVVVVLVMLISLGAYRYSFYMESQYRVTRTHEEQVHARLAAISGLELATAIVELPLEQREGLGGLANNESVFRDIVVSDVPQSLNGERDPNAWRFSLVAPLGIPNSNAIRSTDALPTAASNASFGASPLAVRFGMENEAAKIHIPTLLAWDRMRPGHARAALLGLPGANEAIVEAWLRELGASNLLNKSADNPSASLDDIRQAWFGGDLNQNYQLDPLERRLMSQSTDRMRRSQTPSASGTNTSVAFTPLQRYLTWHSGHRNLTRKGTPRINLNDPDLAALQRNLLSVWSSDRVNFVIAMRQFGPGSGAPAVGITGTATAPTVPTTPSAPTASALLSTPSAANTAGSSSKTSAAAPQVELVQNWTPDLTKGASYTFRSPLELIGAMVDLPPVVTTTSTSSNVSSATSVKRVVRSPFSSDLADARNYLSSMLDNVTIDLSPASVGRIDASQAPLEVLAAVPGMDLTLAQRIVQHRASASNSVQAEDRRDTIAWLVDVMDLNKLKELEPYLCSRSDVYSVQSVGYRDNKSAVYRMTATIDASVVPAQLRNPKVWHPWDRGFSIDQLANLKP